MSQQPSQQVHDDEDDLPAALALPVGTKNYISTTGYQRLKSELDKLVHHDRPETVSVVSWAAGNGDRSENGDYIYGKKRLREIDKRIRFLTKRLENAEVVDVAQQRGERIFFGATVSFMRYRVGVPVTGQVERITIVGVDEFDPAQFRVSWVSPIARALLKADNGDSVRLTTPDGVDTLDIEEVIYQAWDAEAVHHKE